MRFLLPHLLSLTAAAAPAAALDRPSTDLDVSAAADFFGNCAGVWDFASDVAAADGKPATAEQLRNTGNGAQTAALWLLSTSAILSGEKPRAYGSWLPLVEPRRENAKLRMYALLEQDRASDISSELDVCLGALEDQEGMLREIRRGMVREAQGDD